MSNTEGVYDIKREQCCKCREEIVKECQPTRDLKMGSPAWRRRARELQERLAHQPYVMCLVYVFDCAGDGGMIALCHRHMEEATNKVKEAGERKVTAWERPTISASS
jgi:hypothetical protein